MALFACCWVGVELAPEASAQAAAQNVPPVNPPLANSSLTPPPLAQPPLAHLPLAQRLTAAAQSAPADAQADGTLYGIQRWNTATKASYLGMQFPGLLACAYTVSAIFKKAGHSIGTLASVRQVATALDHWPKITDAQQLQPGDVIFWKPKHLPLLGNLCGTTHWHVGISLGADRTIDNDWWSGLPRENSVSRLCSTFAYARRPPAGS